MGKNYNHLTLEDRCRLTEGVISTLVPLFSYFRIRRSGRVESEKIGCSMDAMSSLGMASSTSQMKKSAVGWRSGSSGGRGWWE